MKAARWLTLAALAACQGQGSDAPKVLAGSGSSQAAGPNGTVGTDLDRAAKGPVAEAPAPKLTAVQLIAKLGAIPVWEGVVQRGQLLARRGQRGVLYGRVGPAVGEGSLVWLIDDTDGEGSLAVRASFAGATAPAGARIAATGAWMLPEEPAPAPAAAPAAGVAVPPAPAVVPAARRWVWQVEHSTALPDEGAPPATSSPIGHQLRVGPRPVEAVPISRAKDNDLIVFQVLAAPRRGGIDFRQPDEQWRLRRGVTYVVRIGKIRRKDPSKPATINARNAPIML
jgi:hypothetical protein